MTEGSVARRYAKALLDLGRDAGKIDRFGDDLLRFTALVTADQGQFMGVMAHPEFSTTERRNLLDAALAKAGVDPMVQSFLRLLLDKGRFDALVQIERAYRDLADAEANRTRATLTTATPISAALAQEVKASLEAATGKVVVLETTVDPSLIGGMVARVGGKVYDASLRTRLDQLALNLSQNAQA